MGLRKRKPPRDHAAVVAEWEAVLAREGLAPLDDGREISRRGTPTRIQPGQAAYWDRALAFLHQYPFDSDADRQIWQAHCDGAHHHINDYALRRRRGTTVKAIRRLEVAMMSYPLDVSDPALDPYEPDDPSGRVVTSSVDAYDGYGGDRGFED